MPTSLSTPAEEFTRRSSPEQAARYIRRLIFDGELRPGNRVPQDEVARALGISRIPVREALIALEREGWVTIAMHRGAFVTALDEQAVRDHYALSGLIYGFAAERAVLRAGAELVPGLEMILQQMQQTDDPIEIGQLALEFHGRVIDAAHSPRIRVVLRSMSSLIPVNFLEQMPGAADTERRRFPSIVRAMSRLDGSGAATEYARSMSAQGERALRVLESRGLLDPPSGEQDQVLAVTADTRSPTGSKLVI